MLNHCTPLWLFAHLEVKMWKNCSLRSTFGRSHIWKWKCFGRYTDHCFGAMLLFAVFLSIYGAGTNDVHQRRNHRSLLWCNAAFCRFFVDIRIWDKWCVSGQGSDVVYVIECHNHCLGAVQWTGCFFVDIRSWDKRCAPMSQSSIIALVQCCFLPFFVDIRIRHKWCVLSQGSNVVYVSECCNPCFGLYCRGHVPAQTFFFESSLLWWYCRRHVLAHVIICCGFLSLHSVIASGCVNGCAYVSSRFLWVTCVSLLISSAYVSVSLLCVSSDRRCSHTVDPDDLCVSSDFKCLHFSEYLVCRLLSS